MITYASYIASNPLPRFSAPLRIEYVEEPPPIGRIHRIAVHADSAPRIASDAEYVAALSRSEWRCATQIANAVGVATQTASSKMLTSDMAAITERRTVGRGGRYEWRLK